MFHIPLIGLNAPANVLSFNEGLMNIASFNLFDFDQFFYWMIDFDEFEDDPYTDQF